MTDLAPVPDPPDSAAAAVRTGVSLNLDLPKTGLVLAVLAPSTWRERPVVGKLSAAPADIGMGWLCGTASILYFFGVPRAVAPAEPQVPSRTSGPVEALPRHCSYSSFRLGRV
jgi:hypothetical protein